MLSNGIHNLKAFADNVQFADVNFTTTNLGQSYLTGASGQYTLANFPATGKTATLTWSEPHQNFVISSATRNDLHNAPSLIRAGITGNLESPQSNSFESGIGLIRGWMCQANNIELQIDGGVRRQVAYGTARGDTQTTCGGNANTGFGFVYNWNSLGDGIHNLKLFVDNQEFTNVNFTVTTLGESYLQGLNREETLPNFPSSGRNVKVRWAEPHQNFVIVDTQTTTCNYSISPSSTNFLAAGGTFNVNVYAENGCNWTATTNNTSWITITQGNSGSGNGTVKFSVANNTSANSRTATLTIAGRIFTVTQDAGAVTCNFSIAPTSQSFSSNGGSGSITVSTANGCSWTAVSNVNWINITSGANGTGNGTVKYSLTNNSSSSSRSGSLTVAGKSFNVQQSGASGGGGSSLTGEWDANYPGNDFTVDGREYISNIYVSMRYRINCGNGTDSRSKVVSFQGRIAGNSFHDHYRGTTTVSFDLDGRFNGNHANFSYSGEVEDSRCTGSVDSGSFTATKRN